MTGVRNLTIPIAWSRPLLTLLAGLALAFGMAAPHDVAVERAGPASSIEISETAIHPDAPAHLEDAEFKVHSGCVACLLQLGSSTVLDYRPASLSPPPQGQHVARPAARLSSADSFLSGPARAPPTSSPSA